MRVNVRAAHVKVALIIQMENRLVLNGMVGYLTYTEIKQPRGRGISMPSLLSEASVKLRKNLYDTVIT